MGTTYRFQCPSCSYEAKVSGGPDSGMMCRTQTMVCNDCRSLVDVVVAYINDDGEEIDVLDGIDTELIKDDGPFEKYARLFTNRAIAAYKVNKNSFESLNDKKGFCPFCENRSASVSTVTDVENLVWGDLCPQCQHNKGQVFHSQGFAYFYMIEEAKKKGIKQKSNHCPICGQKIDKGAEYVNWSTRDGTYPCRKCFAKLLTTQWDLAKARSLNVCGLCRSKNLTEWPSTGQGRCPKCGGEMLRKGLVEFWD